MYQSYCMYVCTHRVFRLGEPSGTVGLTRTERIDRYFDNIYLRNYVNTTIVYKYCYILIRTSR